MVDYQSLVGLPWEYGKQDCYTVVQQYFALQGITLPDFERPEDLDISPSVYLREAVLVGFKQVPIAPDARCDFGGLRPDFAPVERYAECCRGSSQLLCKEHCSGVPICSGSGCWVN
jgi:hypothetical protein